MPLFLVQGTDAQGQAATLRIEADSQELIRPSLTGQGWTIHAIEPVVLTTPPAPRITLGPALPPATATAPALSSSPPVSSPPMQTYTPAIDLAPRSDAPSRQSLPAITGASPPNPAPVAPASAALPSTASDEKDFPAQPRLSELSPLLAVFLHVWTLGLFGLFYYPWLHSQLPKTRPDDPTGGRAFGFLFIPFFNLYWVFFCYGRLCLRISEQRAAHGLPPNRLHVLVTILGIGMILLIPYGLNLFLWAWLSTVLVGLLQTNINELAQVARARGSASA